MLTAAITLICLGLAGLVFGLSPDGWLELISAAVPSASSLALHTPPQAIMAVAGAIYLSGIILLAGALLRRTAIAHFQTLTRQRTDLESLQSAVLVALERLELDYRETYKQKQLVSSGMRDLADEFERANALVRDDD